MSHTAPQLSARVPFPSTVAVDARRRVAWLLRVNRLLGAHGGHVSLPAFARVFRGGCFGHPVSASALSRWETGQVAVGSAAVSRYEELLGVPRGLLLATAQTTLRYLAPSALSRPPLAGTGHGLDVASDRAQALLDRALSSDLMRGEDWARLTGALCEIDRFVLVPTDTWYRITERLVEEMVIANGTPWMLRFEALNRLLNHPRAAQHAIAVCASMARDGSNYAATEVICALDNTAHADAAARVLAELQRPTGQRALQGAVMACIRKIHYRHFTPSQLRRLGRAAHDIGPEWDLFGQVRALSGALREPPGPVPARRTRIGAPDAGRAPAELAAVVRRVLRQARRSTPSDGTDAVLSALVTEMLCHPLFDVRLYTAVLLAATPHRGGLADAVVTELDRPHVAAAPSCALPLLGALRVLGDAGHRGTVERLALSPGLPRATVSAAVHSLGQIDRDPDDDVFFTRALAQYSREWTRRRDPAAAATLSGLVYVMGRARRTDLIRDVRDRPDHPLTAREAAAWWLGLSERTLASSLV
ncbi:XRE family transcriptional regulator [Streptomyces sp. NPDC000987]|uniref:XRE family transcriptional regulator n=1 Tax=Streptomyces sp. NPDC000987 TaxID=3154374 RepID=UPI003331FBA7